MKFLPQEVLGRSIFWWFKNLGILQLTAKSALAKRIMQQGDPIFSSGELQALIRLQKVRLKPRAVKADASAVGFEDRSLLVVPNIIWATGFVPDYGWLQIPGALDGQEKPLHQRGVSPIEGLYFLGLPWQHKRSSALIGGAGADAEYLSSCIADKEKKMAGSLA